MPAKVISGGPMMGFAQASLETATTKTTSGILLLSAAEVVAYDSTPCISCGRCVAGCPMQLVPSELSQMLATSSGDLWRTTYVPDTYATSTSNIANQAMVVTGMGLIAGQTVDTFGVYVTSATTAGVISAALYKTIIGSDGNIAGGALEYNFGTIDATTTGLKVINGAGHTLGATTDNTYFLAVWNGSGSSVGITGVSSTQLSGMLSHMSPLVDHAHGAGFDGDALCWIV